MFRHKTEPYSVPVTERASESREFHRYAQTNHAFMNEEAPAFPHDPVAAKFAMELTCGFFKQFL